MIATGEEYTPPPVISHAILKYNTAEKKDLAEGIVITLSHNRRQPLKLHLPIINVGK